MKTVQNKDYFKEVVDGINELHNQEIPDHLKKKNAKRMGNEFDPNDYFLVLKHLSMEEGYKLDYFYYYDRLLDGCPCLYARKENEVPIETYSQYEGWLKDNYLKGHIIPDDTLESCFELVVFNKLSGQFYLYWHANYNDIKIIITNEDVENIIAEAEDLDTPFSPTQIERARALDPIPRVVVHDRKHKPLNVDVTCCTFTKWGGFYQLTHSFMGFDCRFHDILNESFAKAKVSYHCGFRY